MKEWIGECENDNTTIKKCFAGSVFQRIGDHYCHQRTVWNTNNNPRTSNSISPRPLRSWDTLMLLIQPGSNLEIKISAIPSVRAILLLLVNVFVKKSSIKSSILLKNIGPSNNQMDQYTTVNPNPLSENCLKWPILETRLEKWTLTINFWYSAEICTALEVDGKGPYHDLSAEIRPMLNEYINEICLQDLSNTAQKGHRVKYRMGTFCNYWWHFHSSIWTLTFSLLQNNKQTWKSFMLTAFTRRKLKVPLPYPKFLLTFVDLSRSQNGSSRSYGEKPFIILKYMKLFAWWSELQID